MKPYSLFLVTDSPSPSSPTISISSHADATTLASRPLPRRLPVSTLHYSLLTQSLSSRSHARCCGTTVGDPTPSSAQHFGAPRFISVTRLGDSVFASSAIGDTFSTSPLQSSVRHNHFISVFVRLFDRPSARLQESYLTESGDY